MAGYRESRTDRAKAAAGALAVHVVLGAAFLTGLATDIGQRKDDSLKTFDVNEPPPPIAEPPPEQGEAARDDPGEAGKKAEPTPVVVPPPRIELPAESPVVSAPVAGVGASPSAGAAAAGSGTGAGGSGAGRGGGGGGSGGGIGAEARLLSGNRARLPSRLLRRFAADRGYAHLNLTVAGTGRVVDCTVVQGTGISEVDQMLCGVMLRQSRWAPARDTEGRPITVQVRYTSTWSKD